MSDGLSNLSLFILWVFGFFALLSFDLFMEAFVFEWLSWNGTDKNDWFFVLWWGLVVSWFLYGSIKLYLRHRLEPWRNNSLNHSPRTNSNHTTAITALLVEFWASLRVLIGCYAKSKCCQLQITPPMSLLTLYMIASFGVLVLLWLSYWLRGENKPKIPFVYWCFAQIYCFIAILGVGMIHAHLDCMSLWGDCYVHHYPGWLYDFKPLLLNSIKNWCWLAGGATLINVLNWYRSTRWMEIVALTYSY
jgi:hypothetical protein